MTSILIDSYPELNCPIQCGAGYVLAGVHPSSDDNTSAMAQSFKTPNNKDFYRLTSCKFHLFQWGNPIGHLVARLYAHDRTFGWDSIPTGEPLAESEPVDMATIPYNCYQLIEFTFSGNQQYLMKKDTVYCIALIVKDSTNISYEDFRFVVYCMDSTAPSHAGSDSFFHHGYWDGYLGYYCDVIFYIYGDELNIEDLNHVDCEAQGYFWFSGSCHATQQGTINEVKKRLENLIVLAEPTANVFGDWQLALEQIYGPVSGLKLPLVTVRISPYEPQEMTYARRIPESGSMVRLNFTAHCFAEACELEGEEKYKYAHDLADKILSYLSRQVWEIIPHSSYPIVDVYNLSAWESEPTKGSRKICRMIVEGTILAKRTD